jgi:thiamine transport system ATP-binding protein
MQPETDISAIHLDHVRFAWPQMDMKFDLKVAANKITIITGPSGSGKSTLLNLIAGFESPIGGTIAISSMDYTNSAISRRPVSILFQEHNLFPHLTVETNAGFGIAPRRMVSVDGRRRVKDALASVGLSGKENRLPYELSGGERQRAALARVLLENRPVLLLDEPFASLGPSLRREMMELLTAMQRANPRTILAVTHHPQEWRDIAECFIFVDQGRIVGSGAMSNLDNPSLPEGIRNYLGASR